MSDWYACDIDRKELKSFMRRNDHVALARFGLWLACLVAAGVLAYLSLGTWWIVPTFLLYGILFAFAEPVAHECSHGTAFRTRWINETVHFISALMAFKDPTLHRWGHARHHTHTIMVGKDPEIQLPQPMRLSVVAGELTRFRQAWNFIRVMFRNAMGSIPEEVKEWAPESEHPKLIRGARWCLLIYTSIIVWAVVAQSWLPIVFLLLPRFVGGWMYVLLAFTQHAGLASNVTDHRRNTRDVYMNPLFEFLYWNMNYHIEHHVYPLVPFHALPALHERLKDQLPKPYDGIGEVYAEMIDVYRKQRNEPGYHVEPTLPEDAAAPVRSAA